ncbi:hypothetical protein LMG22037_03600 [Paraburkholderia phenoliruptrix]|uniref:Uncharacterized protein n=1 Tax=Paraburkholderia phenoliruptrix TaxID=252970 RepID=A0A6J5BDY3_9BURK|nr:hypothetical protein [Paraburkholderia phenoliruptrix]CAB3702842.1 hypothetical protein LMG22037_03600 [Paraburkholderia phenoliruptrix]
MLYLKNTLGGLSRSLTDSALHSFQGPHRWWKLALFAVLFVLPGGSVGVAVLAWFEHRRGRKGAKGASLEIAAAPVRAASAAAAPAHGAANACQSRGEAPCRAAAGKLARKATSAESRG